MDDYVKECLGNDPIAMRVYTRVRSKLVGIGDWQEIYLSPLIVLAINCSSYWKQRHIDSDETRAKHKVVRELLADFFMITQGRESLYSVNQDGEDWEIAELVK